MRRRLLWIFGIAVILAAGGVITLAIQAFRSKAPVLNAVSVEPAMMADEQWRDMWLLTLSIANPHTRPGNGLYFDDGGKPIRAKLGDRWIDVDGPLTKVGSHEIAPGRKYIALLVLPAKTEFCQISLRWTDSVLKKGRIAWLLQRLPGPLRRRVSNSVWRRAGYVQYGPADQWEEGVLSVPLPAKELTTVAPAN